MPSSPSPQKKFTPTDQIWCNLRLSRGHFMEIKSAFLSTLPPTGTTSVMTRWRSPHFKTMNNWPPSQVSSNLSTHSPLVTFKLNVRSGSAMYEIKNCNIMKPHTDSFQASLTPHKPSLPAQLVFFFHKMTIILNSMSLFGLLQQFIIYFLFLKTAHTNKRSFERPTGISHLQLTRPIQLPFTDIHSHYWHSHSCQTFHILQQATDMVNLSLSKHSLFLSQNMAQRCVGMIVFKLNACPWE